MEAVDDYLAYCEAEGISPDKKYSGVLNIRIPPMIDRKIWKQKYRKTKRVNQGANVRKTRQMVGMKQEVLAKELGITQQSILSIEQKKVIEEDTLLKIASILKVSPKIIEEMDDSPISVIIENNHFEDGSHNNGIGYINEFELIDNKIIYPVEKILELSKENASLYERMMTIEKEKVALLEQLQLLKAKE